MTIDEAKTAVEKARKNYKSTVKAQTELDKALFALFIALEPTDAEARSLDYEDAEELQASLMHDDDDSVEKRDSIDALMRIADSRVKEASASA